MIFRVCVVNLDAGSYVKIMPEKNLSKAKKEKKDKDH